MYGDAIDAAPVSRAEGSLLTPRATVHLREDLVQRLLPLVVPALEAAARRALAADGVDLVDEDDAPRKDLTKL